MFFPIYELINKSDFLSPREESIFSSGHPVKQCTRILFPSGDRPIDQLGLWSSWLGQQAIYDPLACSFTCLR